jgi:hypothetical protein
MKSGRIIREREPIGIRRKDFWDVPQTASLLGERFTKKLGHEPDGLVFQPIEEVKYFFGNDYFLSIVNICFCKALPGRSMPFRLKVETTISQFC